ncbi:MAG TPA: hypothetical protein ENK85_03875 [Saprospiraceae bacterium]|nr:hypothetical protein [Saprospiraceae bacterium]
MKLIKNWGIFLFLLVSTVSIAQPQPQRKEKIKALKIGFITEQLQLTAKESEKFWPIYNKFEADRKALGKRAPRSKVDSMNDQELAKLLDDLLNRQEQQLQLKRQLIQDLKGVLPLRKIVKLEFVEKMFKRELLQRLREGRRGKDKGRAGRNRRPPMSPPPPPSPMSDDY